MSARRLGVSAALVDGALLPGDVAVADGLVTDVGLPAARGGRIASPGLVDLQVNGFAGIDLMGADADEVRAVGRALAGYGVTAWLPTLITARTDRHCGRAEGAGHGGADRARPLGRRRRRAARRAPGGAVPVPAPVGHPPPAAPA